MRVLLVPYPHTWAIEGGHLTQQFQTARALRRAGAQVVVGDVALARTGHFDVIHLFGDPRPLFASGRPFGRLVISPIHFPSWFEVSPPRWHGGGAGWVTSHFRHALRSAKHPQRRRRRLSDMRDRLDATASADLIVTNSLAEARLLQADANRPLPAIHVAHNGVDRSFFTGSPQLGRSVVGSSPFVLCVGRVEPRKNQLTLARAMRSIPRRLVLLGAVIPGNERYLEA